MSVLEHTFNAMEAPLLLKARAAFILANGGSLLLWRALLTEKKRFGKPECNCYQIFTQTYQMEHVKPGRGCAVVLVTRRDARRLQAHRALSLQGSIRRVRTGFNPLDSHYGLFYTFRSLCGRSGPILTRFLYHTLF